MSFTAALLLLASLCPPATCAAVTAAFGKPVMVGSSSNTKFWFSRLGVTGHHGTVVAPAQRDGDGGGLPCRSPDGCSGKLMATLDGGHSWQAAGPTGLSSINPAEGEFISLIPQTGPQANRTFLTLGYTRRMSADGRSALGGGGDAVWRDEGGGKLMHLRDINVTISGFPAPVRSLVFNPHVVTLKEGGELLSPMYGTLRSPPLGCNAGASGECASVFFVRSSDQGLSWTYVSRIDATPEWLPWTDSEGACEPGLVQLPDGRLLTTFRVDARSLLFEAFSSDDGTSWTVPRRLSAWSVMPQLQLLSNGVLLLTSGRPGIGMWARPTAGGAADDESWVHYDLASEHSKQVAPQWQYTGNTLNASCTGSLAPAACHGRTTCTECTPDGGGTNKTTTPPQTTAYTGMVEVEPDGADKGESGVSVVLVVYDRIANGWDMPPGPWGTQDAIFSMRVAFTATGSD